MDVEEARDDELAARVEDVGGLGCEGGLDGSNAASSNRHVANGIKPD
jgi:hypothetical protein